MPTANSARPFTSLKAAIKSRPLDLVGFWVTKLEFTPREAGREAAQTSLNRAYTWRIGVSFRWRGYSSTMAPRGTDCKNGEV